MLALPCPWLFSALLQGSAQPAATLGCLGCGRAGDATRGLGELPKDFQKGRSGFVWLLEQLRRARVARVLQKQARFFAGRDRVEDPKTSRDHTLNLPGEHPSEISHGERLGGEENHITSAFRSRGGALSRQTVSITAIRAVKPLQEVLKRSNFDIVSNRPGMNVRRLKRGQATTPRAVPPSPPLYPPCTQHPPPAPTTHQPSQAFLLYFF